MRGARDVLAGLATEEEIDEIIAGIKSNGIDNPSAYLRRVRRNGDLPRYVKQQLAEMNGHRPPPPAKPRWCGQCDEQTRLVALEDDPVRRCARCHPLAGEAP